MNRNDVVDHYRAVQKSLYIDINGLVNAVQEEHDNIREVNNKLLSMLSDQTITEYLSGTNNLKTIEKIVNNVFEANHKIANNLQHILDLYEQRAKQARLYVEVEK